jgi:diguanylate cyclase (GGDEF)-like protein
MAGTTRAALLVEDSRFDYRNTRGMLLAGRSGVERLDWVQEWHGAREALEGGPYELFLVDLNLGPTSGLEAIRELRRAGVLAPIIALTGHSDDQMDRACTEAGASDFLVKGEFDQRSLERAVRYAARNAGVHRELERLNAELERRARADLATSSGRLKDAVEVMSDGFALFDGELRLVVWNSRFAFFFRAAADKLQAGTGFGDLLRCMAERGAFDDVDRGAAEDFVAEQLRQLRTGHFRREAWINSSECLEIVQQRTSEAGWIAIARDVTDRKLLERDLRHRALRDGLTGLWNRAAFVAELDRIAANATEPATSFGVLLVDLDNFKEVNDTLGHEAGDQLLVEVARRLEATRRAGDFVARLGGDEFAMLVADVPQADGLDGFAERVLAVMAAPVVRDGFELRPSASIGVAIRVDAATAVSELMVAADRALYLAKQDGRGTWRRAVTGSDDAEHPHLLRAVDVLRALERDEFDLDYQPIISLETREVVGLEALVRWQHPARGRLTAGEFIATFDRQSMIQPVTRSILRAALATRRWLAQGGWFGLDMWVNLAPACLAWPDLVAVIAAEIALQDGSAEHLVLELTEGAFVGLQQVHARLAELRALGARIAIDNFGVDHCALSRLTAPALDIVKLDRRFMTALARDPRNQAIVRAVVGLCRDLDLTVVACGMEAAEQVDTARRLGVSLGQGYLLGRPVRRESLPDWLEAWRAAHAVGGGVVERVG